MPLQSKKQEELSTEEKKTLSEWTTAKEELTKADKQSKLDDSLAKIYADAVATAEEDFKQAKGRVRTSAGGGASIPLQIQQRQVSDGAVEKVANAVQFIVSQIFTTAFSDGDDLCYRRLLRTRGADSFNKMAELCYALAKSDVVAAQRAIQEERKPAAGEATPPPPAAKPGQKPANGAGARPAPKPSPPKADAGQGSKPAVAGSTQNPSSIAQRRLDAANARVEALKNVIVPPTAASAPSAPTR